MTCNYTMIQGIGNWRHFIIIHYSKEFILAATQNMYEYCIRLNIWCRHTVTYYVNAYVERVIDRISVVLQSETVTFMWISDVRKNLGHFL